MARTGKNQRRRYTTARYAVASLVTGEILREYRRWQDAVDSVCYERNHGMPAIVVPMTTAD